MKVALTTGAYQARSIIANAQRCVNLFPERNPGDSPFPTTHYCTPGTVLIGTAPESVFRGLYAASNGKLYGAIGQSLYLIGSDWSFTKLGTLKSSGSQVSMADNSVTLLVVDGSVNGYTVDLISDAFSYVSDPAFYGADRVDMVDGFFVLNRPGTNQWYASNPFAVTFNALDFAGKTGASDPLVTLAVARRYIFLLGTLTTEIWYDAGNQDFTFGRMPGAFIQHGCGAKNSVASMDGSIYWLAQEPQGHAMILRIDGFEAKRVSTHAIENEFQNYSRIDDAIGYTFQQGGHFFYALIFPTADKTWVYDLSTDQWHEWLWLDGDGAFHRHRGNCFAFWNNTWIVGDWQNGNLYSLDTESFTDNGTPISRVRSFPHLINNGYRVMYREFVADMEVGNGDGSGSEPQVWLRWSDTKGASWGNAILGGIGNTGQYLRSIQFQRLGMARDRVFELAWSANCKTALNGAFIDAIPANQ